MMNLTGRNLTGLSSGWVDQVSGLMDQLRKSDSADIYCLCFFYG